MPRLTRAESQAHTRGLLVETARTLFLREGFAGTSLEKVAEEAGFSKGAVYSNFSSKDDLCLEVLATIQQEVAEAVRGSLLGAATLDEALVTFEVWAEARLGDPDWSALEAEFAARSRREPQLRAALDERNRQIRATIEDALRVTCQRHGIAPRIDFADLALVLFSLGVGLGLQRSVTPSLPVRVLSDLVRVVANLPAPDPGGRP